MNDELFEQRQAVISEVGRRFRPFVEARVNPHAGQRHRQGEAIPKAVFQEAAALGLLAYKFPESLGGEGRGDLRWGLLLEELGYLCEDICFPVLLSVFTGVAEYVHGFGSPAAAQKLVGPMLRGDLLGVFAYSEEADHFSFASRAEKRPEGYVLNGDKSFVSGGEIADLFMTYVPDQDSEMLVFLVDRDVPGVELEPRDVIGWRSAGICRLKLTEVQVPLARAIVQNDGLSHSQRYLNSRRVFLSCAFLGRMAAILERCVSMAESTRRHGRYVTEFQNVQAAIGRMTILHETARSCLYRALEQMGSGRGDPSFDAIHSIAKHVVADHGRRLIETAMHIAGGRGYLESQCYGRDLADFCALIPAAGTQDLLEINIGMLKANEIAVRNRQAARR